MTRAAAPRRCHHVSQQGCPSKAEVAIVSDAVVATAILDCLLHHSHVITIRGVSYRLREKRRSGLLKPAAKAPQPAAISVT